MTLSPSLAALHAIACSQHREPPPWDDVVSEARSLRLGVAHVDSAVMAGLATDSVLMTAADSWPDDVNRALEHLGLFEKYSPTTLQGVLANLSSRQIDGLTNTVKGTVLELHVQDALNSGAIPMVSGAERAELASSLNQPGWDVAQLGATGDHLARLQVKATDSWQYIAQHLSRYPEYPVATTREAAESAAANGVDPELIIDTGISAAELTGEVASTLGNLDLLHVTQEFVPELAIAAIGVVALVKLKNGAPREEVSGWVKEQAALAGLANAAGLVTQVLTGTVILRPFATMGVGLTAARGSIARKTGDNLRRMRATLVAIRKSNEARGYVVDGRRHAWDGLDAPSGARS